MRLTPRILALALLVSLSAACTGTSEPQFSDLSGVYRLQVDQTPSLVIVEPRSSATIPVTAGVLELNPLWRFQINYTQPSGDLRGVTGSYRRTENGLIFEYYGMADTATVDRDLVTVNTSYGTVLVFEKVGS